MPRSKLEKYLNILEVLVRRPLHFEKISYKANMDCRLLKRYLNSLISQKLVEERPSSNEKAIYAITERGLAVFKTLQAQKYLRKLKNILPIVEEANEVGSLLSRPNSELEES